MSVVNAHLNDLPVKFSVCVNEGQDKLPTMYWLPKLHKRPYKARFIANSSSCTTTELSKLLTSCLTAIKSHVIRYCETVYETSNKNWFWSIKNSGEVLSKLKCRGFRATNLSTYDFSTLYTTLPHNLIKEKLLDLIEWTFKRALKTMVHFIWHAMTERLFSLPLTKKVQVGKDQEKAQSEKDSHSKNRGGKKPNQQSGTYTMKHIVSRMSSYFPNRWPLSYLNLTKNMKTYIRRQQHKKFFKHQDIKRKEPPQKFRLGTISNTKLLAGLNRFYMAITSPSASAVVHNI